MLDPEVEDRRAARRLAEKIAATLGETDPTPLDTIGRMVLVLGEDRCLALSEQALQVFAAGGLPTDDGKRKRTLGGVFFKLAKSSVTGREFFRVFGSRPIKSSSSPARPAERSAPVPPLTWADAEALGKEALALPKGEATTVKITLIGRPGKVVEKQGVVLTSMASSRVPSLPKGLPQPPADPTVYIVFIASKHWEKVRAAMENPEDVLIVEGYPNFDRRIGQQGAMCVLAQNVTTKLLQQAKRQAQPAGE